MAFEQAGFRCLLSSEWDQFARKTYMTNFGDLPFGDVRNLSYPDLLDHDVLVAGFPCQPFSTIGRRAGFSHETQGTMFHEVVRILAEARPQAFLLENVKGLLTHDGGRTWEVIQKSLSELGYFFSFKILNSADFGVPQNRLRVFIVGFLDIESFEAFDFPDSKELDSDFSIHVEENSVGYEISKHLQKSYIFKSDAKHPQIVDENWFGPVKTLVASYHKIQRLTGTFVKGGSTGLRLLSKGECLAIMGFPSGFELPVSRTQMYRQLGNSVAIPVVREIALRIKHALQATRQGILETASQVRISGQPLPALGSRSPTANSDLSDLARSLSLT